VYLCLYNNDVIDIPDFKIFTINKKDIIEEIEERRKTIDVFISEFKKKEKILLTKKICDTIKN
jgi:hypothetical protein